MSLIRLVAILFGFESAVGIGLIAFALRESRDRNREVLMLERALAAP
jgi:hypothetical protein